MGAIANVFSRFQAAIARIEYFQDFRPFFRLVEWAQHRQAGPARPVPSTAVQSV